MSAVRDDDAAANDGVLPTDVLREVLLHLPADVLCRLRLVCRSWRQLTSDTTFAESHLSRHPLVAGIRYIAGRDREVLFVDMSGDIVKRIPIMGQDWDGYTVSVRPNLYSSHKTRVLNPRTGAFTVLPANIAAEHESRSTPILSLSLLGQILSTGEYKALRIHQYLTHGGEQSQTCEVMAVGNNGSGGWWMARASPPVRVAATPMHGVVVNGVAYFLLYFDSRCEKIASFDLATEEWRPDTLEGPFRGFHPFDDDEKRDVCFHLAKLNGSLVTACRYFSRHDNYKDRWMDLWFLVDMDKGQWTKLYTLPCTSRAPGCGLTCPLEALNDGRILLSDDGGRCIRIYDPKTNISTDVAKLENFSGVCMYQGSLLCSDLQY